jgi:hypothetical protein
MHTPLTGRHSSIRMPKIELMAYKRGLKYSKHWMSFRTAFVHPAIQMASFAIAHSPDAIPPARTAASPHH